MFTQLLIDILDRGLTIAGPSGDFSIQLGPPHQTPSAKPVPLRSFRTSKALASEIVRRVTGTARREPPIPAERILAVLHRSSRPLNRVTIAKRLGCTPARLLRRMATLRDDNTVIQDGAYFKPAA